MRALIPLLFLAGCTAATPVVTVSGQPPAPAYRVTGDDAAAAELRRQLAARGWLDPAAPTTITAGFARAPRSLGLCLAADPAAPDGCTTWDQRRAGFAPLAPSDRLRLVLALDGATSGMVDVVQPAGKGATLPGLVASALDRLK